MPIPQPLAAEASEQAPMLGQPGDLVPTCVTEHFGSLEEWQGNQGLYPPGAGPLRLFRCRQWHLLVVPGLRNDRAWEFVNSGHALEELPRTRR